MLIQFLSRRIEKLVNRVLSSDPLNYQTLCALGPRIIAIHLQHAPISLWLKLDHDGIHLWQEEETADLHLRGSVLSMLALAKKPSTLAKVRIEGDVQFAHSLQHCLRQLNIDFEEVLSHYTGDIIAHRVGKILRAGFEWVRESKQAFEFNTLEYLQYETKLLVSTQELKQFCDAVDELRLATDRLRAQMQYREQSICKN